MGDFHTKSSRHPANTDETGTSAPSEPLSWFLIASRSWSADDSNVGTTKVRSSWNERAPGIRFDESRPCVAWAKPWIHKAKSLFT